MIARILRVTVAPDQIDDILIQYRESVRPMDAAAIGLRQNYILVDRKAGKIEFIGVWNSPEAINAIASELEPARAELWTHFGQQPRLKIFDVVDELR